MGYTGVDYIDFEGRTWLEWGYRPVPECRGLGYATEAGQAPPNRRVRQEAALRRRLHLARDGQEAEVAETTLTEAMVAEVMAELAELEDPKTRAVNEKHGDDHGVNLSKLRAVAKRLKTQQELARRLWTTADTATPERRGCAQITTR